jgi:hypothetical protein
LILPVNYALDGHVIVIRTGPGTKLTAAQHANVAFEVDAVDEQRGTGWSVLVLGVAEMVTDQHSPDVIRRTHTSGVEPWAPGEHPHWLRLMPKHVTGRRLVAGDSPPPFEAAGYL